MIANTQAADPHPLQLLCAFVPSPIDCDTRLCVSVGVGLPPSSPIASPCVYVCVRACEERERESE